MITLAKTLGIDPGPQGQTDLQRGRRTGGPRAHRWACAMPSRLAHRAPALSQGATADHPDSKGADQGGAGWLSSRNSMPMAATRCATLRSPSHLDDTVNGWFFGVNGPVEYLRWLGRPMEKSRQARASLEIRQGQLRRFGASGGTRSAAGVCQSADGAGDDSQPGRRQSSRRSKPLRLAKERLAAGAGTQLDVLNAQVQLTTARSTEFQARANYNTALAEFDRVTATDTVFSETFEDPLTHRGRNKAPAALPADQGNRKSKKTK